VDEYRLGAIMNNKSDQNPENFDELESLFSVMRAIPQRDPIKAAGTRAKFYSELQNLAQPTTHRITVFQKLKEKINMSTPRRKAIYLSLAAVLVLALVLFSGAGITAVAASRALPGDGLFSVKTGIEKTKINLQSSDADQAYLSLKISERRLEELQILVESGRFSDLSDGINAFQVNIQQALTAAANMMQYDPHGAQALYSKISEYMLKFAHVLAEYSLLLPASAINLLEDGYRFSD
jgi:hypothetical protein